MAQNRRFLHELLKEDQEPFILNKYISERRSQMKNNNNTCLQTRKRKSINYNKASNFSHLCKNACLFSFPDTPNLTKSPLFEFASPVKSPRKSPNEIFLHIPSRTATLLLEAALKIQKQSSRPKAQAQTRLGLFGSLFKRLTQRNYNHKGEIEDGNDEKVTVKWDPSVGRRKVSDRIGAENQRERVDLGISCSYNGRSSSSAVWSESNEDKSLDMETSSSGNSDDDDSERIRQFGNIDDGECGCCHRDFCESPFRFVLQTTPSSGSRTPELLSPSRYRTEEKESNEGEREEEEEEEDKEQCSPVCVLDPPFDDDDERHVNDDEFEEESGYDLESSYAIVQRAKQQLLYKLRRFEKLAELDPVELEKRMLEQEEDGDEAFIEEEEEDYCEDIDSEASSSYKESEFQELVFEALNDTNGIPEEFKKLVSDLIMEEERELNSFELDREVVVKRICKRMELWKEVESNTIDMMIEEDFSREDGEWKKNVEQVRKIARELELAIFGFLVEEFSEELVC